eukprot:gene2411-2561_t
MTKTVSFKVGMTCSGCQGAVTRVLGRVSGVTNVNANLSTKRVDVECEDSVEDAVLIDALKKWAGNSGKSVEVWV